MHGMPVATLRRNAKLYNCIFMGERSHDAGGPYREVRHRPHTQKSMQTCQRIDEIECHPERPLLPSLHLLSDMMT